MERDSNIQEQEKCIVNLKMTLERRPGPEIAEQLSASIKSSRTKDCQMKSMAAELNMHQAQVFKYKREMNELENELHKSKRKFFQQKKREVAFREKQLALLSEKKHFIDDIYGNNESGRKPFKLKYAGGGFAIK
mmetsp:Transcript_10602/g.14961  ORF Transcript_10602/g.14961 Transcript_10602/m.14961 type:complete len:134 (+) Transcript_10602:1771-2172(+)